MLRGKKAYVLTLAAIAAVTFIGQAYSQEAPQDGGRRGNRDPEQQRQRMEQFRQQMETRMKEALGVSDDEWKVLQPKIEKVTTLSRETRFGGMNFFRMGRRGGDNQATQANDRPQNDRPQSDVEKKMGELQTLLQNKDASPDSIKVALAGYREARTKAKEELDKAQTDLRELLTMRQEAVLVSMGILD